MKIVDYKDIKAEPIKMEGANGNTIRWLISEKDHAPNFAMRLIEVVPRGYGALHDHEWEHEIFVLEGEGTISDGEKEYKMEKEKALFVAPGERHQVKNTGSEILKFLCLIPTGKIKPT